MRCLQAEAAELCSFVGKKAHKQWLGWAMDTQTRQVIAFERWPEHDREHTLPRLALHRTDVSYGFVCGQ
jgi:IS1 family transposase